MAAKRNQADEWRKAFELGRQRRVAEFNQSIETFVAQCGCSADEIKAQLWEFSGTHSAVIFKLSCPNSEEAIYPACLVTSEVHMLVQWKGASIRAELKGDMCEVTDSSGNLRVVCCEVEVNARESYLDL